MYVWMYGCINRGRYELYGHEGRHARMYICMYVSTCQNSKWSYEANADISACMYAAVRIPRGGHGAARLQSLRALATH